MYDYTAQNDDELPFGKGQLINVLSREDPDWWKGELNGSVGLFPSNYVKLTTDTDPSQQCEYSTPSSLALALSLSLSLFFFYTHTLSHTNPGLSLSLFVFYFLHTEMQMKAQT